MAFTVEPYRPSPPPNMQDVQVIGWEDLRERVLRHRVVLGGLVLIVAACIVKGNALSHSYFQQDDFAIVAKASTGPFGFGYLFQTYAGHLIPAVFAVSWVLARVSPYNWGLYSGILLVLAALAGLAMLKALRTLCGERPLILLPLAVYLFTPLTVPALTWWMVGLQEVPFEFAIAMAVDQHVRYLRHGRLRNAIFAAIWILFGLAFNERATVLPVLLLALTSAFFVGGGWAKAIWRTLRQHWPAWSMYFAAMAADIAVYVLQLNTSSEPLRLPSSVGSGASVAWNLLRNTLVPGALGGPWKWSPITAGSSYAVTSTPALLVALSGIAAALTVAASIWSRRHAWRAWAILLGWVVAADIVPIEVGRVAIFGQILGFETRYVADAMPVLAICLAAAFAPVAGERDAYWSRVPAGLRAPALSGFAAGVFLIGSLWSVISFENVTSSTAARSYLSNARAAITAAKPGTVVLDTSVPNSVVFAGLFGKYGKVQQALSPLTSHVRRKDRIRWLQRPAGTIPDLLAFDSLGNLVPIAVVWPYSVDGLPPGAPSCTEITSRGVDLRLLPNPTWAPYPNLRWTLAIGYASGPGVELEVSYGGQSTQVALTKGLGNFYLQVHGTATTLRLQNLGTGGVCVGNVHVGDFGAAG